MMSEVEWMLQEADSLVDLLSHGDKVPKETTSWLYHTHAEEFDFMQFCRQEELLDQRSFSDVLTALSGCAQQYAERLSGHPRNEAVAADPVLDISTEVLKEKLKQTVHQINCKYASGDSAGEDMYTGLRAASHSVGGVRTPSDAHHQWFTLRADQEHDPLASGDLRSYNLENTYGLQHRIRELNSKATDLLSSAKKSQPVAPTESPENADFVCGDATSPESIDPQQHESSESSGSLRVANESVASESVEKPTASTKTTRELEPSCIAPNVSSAMTSIQSGVRQRKGLSEPPAGVNESESTENIEEELLNLATRMQQSARDYQEILARDSDRLNRTMDTQEALLDETGKVQSKAKDLQRKKNLGFICTMVLLGIGTLLFALTFSLIMATLWIV